MSTETDVTIIGAGPYGLSIAAHLRKHNVAFRILGKPMHSWLTNMPKGMLLKSAGFSTNLCDPDHSFPLRQFCKEQGVPYGEIDFPIPLDTFCSYGKVFQERFVPNVEDDIVAAVEPIPAGFEVHLESGKSFATREVVVAVGINHFRHVPKELVHLPKALLSHSADHHDLERFKGKEVLVLGSGASATDIAILLHENRTNVQLIARQMRIDFGEPWSNSSSSLLTRLRNPISGIGPGLRSRLWTDAPWLFRYLSEDARLTIARTFLGPSCGWFMKERAQVLPVLLGLKVKEAIVRDGRVQLELINQGGTISRMQADHIIAATGYMADVARIPFLTRTILGRLKLIGSTPRLSPHFESSVPGFYFVGAISVTSFGPMMRFVAGADFTSRKIVRRLARHKGMKKSWSRRNMAEASAPDRS